MLAEDFITTYPGLKAPAAAPVAPTSPAPAPVAADVKDEGEDVDIAERGNNVQTALVALDLAAEIADDTMGKIAPEIKVTKLVLS